MNTKVVRFIFSLTAAFLFAMPSYALNNKRQVRKNIDQAKTYIKSGKDFDKAEKLMTDLLKDSVNRTNIKIYTTWFDAVRNQYIAANEKLYLKQKYDTAAFYTLTRHVEEVAYALDSLDSRPDKKGRVRPEYRKSNAAFLHSLRLNIYYGGTWHIRKNDYKSSYVYFDDYVNAANNPFFSDYKYIETDSLRSTAAYWATFCGYKMQDAEKILKHSDLALADTSKAQFTLQYKCDAYQLQKNDSAYYRTLKEGFKRYPDYPYFFPRLAEYLNNKKKYLEVLSFAEEGLSVNPNNILFLIAKSVALLNVEKYEECVDVSRKLIESNDSLPEPYFNIATCYLNEALSVEQQNEPRKNRLILKTLYQSARPYMEDYRKLAPADSKRWAPALYRIYLNLNMGKQFEEIDRLMRK